MCGSEEGAGQKMCGSEEGAGQKTLHCEGGSRSCLKANTVCSGMDGTSIRQFNQHGHISISTRHCSWYGVSLWPYKTRSSTSVLPEYLPVMHAQVPSDAVRA